MFYLVHEKGNKGGFLTDDKQLAYETRKGADSNAFFCDGTRSTSALNFCQEHSDRSCVTTEIKPEDLNIGLLVDNLNDLADGFVLNLNNAPGELAAFKLLRHPSNITTSITVTAPRQSGLTTRLLNLSIELEANRNTHLVYAVHQSLVDNTIEQLRAICVTSNIEFPLPHIEVMSKESLYDARARLICLSEHHSDVNLVLVTDNVDVDDDILSIFNGIYRGINTD